MTGKFHERFDIEVGLDDARRRFTHRVFDLVFEGFMRDQLYPQEYLDATKYVAAVLGDEFFGNYLAALHSSGDFLKHLHALEALYDYVQRRERTWGSNPLLNKRFVEQMQEILDMSEIDLGVRWEKGRFLPKGAALLDERLGNEPLRWLGATGYESVLAPYKKGLDHLLRSVQQPQLRADVITDMYEAVEALAKIGVGNGADLSANRERFIAAVKASDSYKRLLKEYIDYANDFRHAAEEGKPKPQLSEREAESFVYLTGVFIRLTKT